MPFQCVQSASRCPALRYDAWVDGISDVDALVATVTERAPWRASHFHGERHWLSVGMTGALLAREVAGVDRTVAFLFALLHDSQRLNDDWDPEHGHRAAALAHDLDGVAFTIGTERLALLTEACRRHTDGGLAEDPTIALCWDADRLNLWRVGKRPDPAYLSTEPARQPEWIERGRSLAAATYDWPTVAEAFTRL